MLNVANWAPSLSVLRFGEYTNTVIAQDLCSDENRLALLRIAITPQTLPFAAAQVALITLCIITWISGALCAHNVLKTHAIFRLVTSVIESAVFF